MVHDFLMHFDVCFGIAKTNHILTFWTMHCMVQFIDGENIGSLMGKTVMDSIFDKLQQLYTAGKLKEKILMDCYLSIEFINISPVNKLSYMVTWYIVYVLVGIDRNNGVRLHL